MIEIAWNPSPAKPADLAAGIDAMHESMLRERTTTATLCGIAEVARSIAAHGESTAPLSYRHRRGRAVSVAAKRRHRRRVAHAIARCVLHAAAAETYGEAAKFGAECLARRGA